MDIKKVAQSKGQVVITYVYIIQSEKNGRFYIGSSSNPFDRLSQHNAGSTLSTKNKGPWKLIFYQPFPSLVDARRAELKLKKQKSRLILEKIIRDQKIVGA